MSWSMSPGPLWLAALVAMVPAPRATAGPTPAQKCTASKLVAAGKASTCLAKATAKTLQGRTGDLAKCDATLTAAFTKLETKGGCATSDDGPTVAARLHAELDLTTALVKDTGPFVDLGDGTVVDSRTGLQWEKKVQGSDCLHCLSREWYWGDAPTLPNGDVFLVFLATLNRRVILTQGSAATQAVSAAASLPGPGVELPDFGCFAGHCDWRLPTIAELETIVGASTSACSPYCNQLCLDPMLGASTTEIDDRGFKIGYFMTSELTMGKDSSYLSVGEVQFCNLQLGEWQGFAATLPMLARAVRTVSAIQSTARCAPATCASQNATCGTLGDGCGNPLDCGTCTAPQTCGGGGVANQCGGGCVPTTCAAQAATCGPIPDGCGGTLDCGSCVPPASCGGAGVPNQCGVFL